MSSEYDMLSPAGRRLIEDATDREDFCQYEAIAELAYEAVRAWCTIIGDEPTPPWRSLSESARNSVIDGARFVIEKPHTSLADQHDNWRAARAGDGWQYGATLDRACKWHPNMVPFDELPWVQQVKDRLFRHVVHAILA